MSFAVAERQNSPSTGALASATSCTVANVLSTQWSVYPLLVTTTEPLPVTLAEQ
jgi:hypothetical protein